MATADLRAPILKTLHAQLAPFGYKRAAALFSKRSQDVFQLIEVQGSRTNTRALCKYTVNIAIFVPALVYEDVREQTKPSVPAAHWRQRIGSLSAAPEDTWWSVQNEEQALAAATDIALRVKEHVLPALDALPDTKSLVALWSSGRSTGTTEHMRHEFLARLNAPSHVGDA